MSGYADVCRAMYFRLVLLYIYIYIYIYARIYMYIMYKFI